MRTVTTLIALCFLAVSGTGACGSDRAANVLQVSGLKSQYVRGDRVEFRVESISDGEQQFTCGVEQQIQGEWREIQGSIFDNDPEKGARLLRLSPHAQLALTWDSGRNTTVAGGTYRLRVDLYDVTKPRSPTQSIYSDGFKIISSR